MMRSKRQILKALESMMDAIYEDFEVPEDIKNASYYHGTTDDHYDSIRQVGLSSTAKQAAKPNFSGPEASIPDRVYLSRDKQYAMTYGDKVFRVDGVVLQDVEPDEDSIISVAQALIFCRLIDWNPNTKDWDPLPDAIDVAPMSELEKTVNKYLMNDSGINQLFAVAFEKPSDGRVVWNAIHASESWRNVFIDAVEKAAKECGESADEVFQSLAWGFVHGFTILSDHFIIGKAMLSILPESMRRDLVLWGASISHRGEIPPANVIEEP